jgi:hypothetical protein
MKAGCYHSHGQLGSLVGRATKHRLFMLPWAFYISFIHRVVKLGSLFLVCANRDGTVPLIDDSLIYKSSGHHQQTREEGGPEEG